MPEDSSGFEAASGMPLPTHAVLMTRAERLNGDRVRGWYFSVLVRATMTRLQGEA